MEREETAALDRLLALAKVNPNIREVEVEQQREAITHIRAHIERSSYKLDAIRVILLTD